MELVKVYWDESEKVEQETYKNLNEEEYQLLVDDDDVEIVEKDSFEDEAGLEKLEVYSCSCYSTKSNCTCKFETPLLYNVVIKRTKVLVK